MTTLLQDLRFALRQPNYSSDTLEKRSPEAPNRGSKTALAAASRRPAASALLPPASGIQRTKQKETPHKLKLAGGMLIQARFTKTS